MLRQKIWAISTLLVGLLILVAARLCDLFVCGLPVDCGAVGELHLSNPMPWFFEGVALVWVVVVLSFSAAGCVSTRISTPVQPNSPRGSSSSIVCLRS